MMKIAKSTLKTLKKKINYLKNISLSVTIGLWVLEQGNYLLNINFYIYIKYIIRSSDGIEIVKDDEAGYYDLLMTKIDVR